MTAKTGSCYDTTQGRVSAMTVFVSLTGGGTDNYMRSGDAYVKRTDGTLDVVRTGAKSRFSYASGEWTDVTGDEKRSKRRRFWS